MRALTICAICASLAQMGHAAAEPCVSAAFDQPMPGATDVVTRRVDVPSPQFPGLWQEGVIGGYFYTLFANDEGVLQSARTAPDWAITFACDTQTGTCDRVSAHGNPPAEAAATADRLERCLVAPETVVMGALPPAELAANAVVERDAANTTPRPSCGLNAIPEGSEGITVQRLLALGGANPGPIDGYPGKRTQKAIGQLLGPQSQELTIAEAIAALDQLLCAAPRE